DILVPKGQALGAVERHQLSVQFTQSSAGPNSPAGQISALFGHNNDPGAHIFSILYQPGTDIASPDDVLQEADNVPDTIQPDDLKGRRDLRDERTISIDGA
ncbi:ribonuclease R, partial [Staphylococcus pseudintermedius]